jgi:hypothetical protein
MPLQTPNHEARVKTWSDQLEEAQNYLLKAQANVLFWENKCRQFQEGLQKERRK